MLESFVFVGWVTVGVYALVGALLVPYLHARVLGRIDEAARGAAWGFRVLVTPGLIALWPAILVKAWRARRGESPHGSPDAPLSAAGIRRLQSLLIKTLAVLLPIAIAAALATRSAETPIVELPFVPISLID